MNAVNGCERKRTEAWEEIYRRYHRDILGQCIKRIHDLEVAEDVAQNTWMNLLRKISSWSGRCPLRNWIYVVTLNQIRMHGRKRSHEPTWGEFHDAGDHSPERALENRSLIRSLTKKNPKLRTDYGEALVAAAHFGEGSMAASALNVSVRNYKARLFRARDAFRKGSLWQEIKKAANY